MNMFTKVLMGISTLVILLGVSISSYYSFQYNQADRLYSSDDDGIALNGYDIVSYFADNTATAGSPQFQVDAFGTRWYFDSLAHQQDFSRDGDLFLPEYGGYDPQAIAISAVTLKSNPEIWSIQDGRLYFFYTFETQRQWLDNYAENVIKADLNWPSLQRKLTYIEERK